MTPIAFVFPGNETFAQALTRHWPLQLEPLSIHTFPDGERLVQLAGNLSGRDVVLICTLNAPDSKALPLVFAADAARDLGARRVILVAPYLAYMRQDRRFHAGEAVTSRSFARLLSAAFDGLVTVDPHLHRFKALDEIYSIPTEVASASPAIARWISNHVASPVVIGPDAESEQWVRHVATLATAPSTVLEKTRLGDREVSISAMERSGTSAATPVLVDDIISTGHTLLEATRVLAAQGYTKPICLGVHAVFGGKLACDDNFERLVTTNTISHETNTIDVSAEVAKAAQRLLGRLKG